MVRECLELLLWRKEREMEGVERARSLFGEAEMELQEGTDLFINIIHLIQ